MTKKHSTKKALMLSILSLVLCFSMLVGTTFAWFTDSVTSANNIIKSGNLDVELYYQAEGQTDWTKVTENTNVFKADTLWEPGHTEVVKLKVVNEGTLALKYHLGVNVASEIGSVNVNDEAFKLSDFIKFGIVDGAQTYTRDQAIAAVDATATALKTAYNSGTTALEAKNDGNTDEKIVTMVVYMPTTVGNEANAKTGAAVPTINLGINLYATQMTAESDSFNDQYDKDAWHPDMEVTTAADLQAALNNGVTNIALADDIDLEEPIVIPAPAASTYSLRRNANAVVINLNGKKITSNLTSGRAILVQGAAEIKNGTITTTNGVGAIYATGKSASLILTDMTVAVTGTGTNKEWILTAVGAAGGAKVVINNGTYSAEKGYGLVVSTSGADVTINDGIFTTEGTTQSAAVRFDSGWDNSKVYTKAVINGGVFNAPEGGFAFTANNAYGKDITINGGTFNGELDSSYQDNGVIINGGTFNKPILQGGGHQDRYLIKGGTFAHNPGKVAEGYEAKQNTDGSYSVVINGKTLTDSVQVPNAEVYVPAGTYTFPSNVAEGVVINCAPGTVFTGKTGLNLPSATVIGATFKNEDIAVSGTINGTFQNCTFEGSEALRWCYSTEGETVVFENCVIKTDFRGFHFDGMNGNVIFRNCEINGFNAYGGTGTITFEGCTFGNDESKYNGLNGYSNTVLKDCEFNFVSGKTNFIDMEGIGNTLTINNCTATLDGEEANVLDFVGGSKLNQNTLIVDGMQCALNTDQLVAAINAGAKAVILAEGDYALRFTNNTNFNLNDMTIKGLGDVNLAISSTEAWYGRVQGSNVTFENIHFTSSVGATGEATYNNCVFDDWTICASSNKEETTFNNCTINGCLNTSTDLSSGDVFVKNCEIAKAEYSGSMTMNFVDCQIGEIIIWNANTNLTNCKVTKLDDSNVTTATVTIK